MRRIVCTALVLLASVDARGMTVEQATKLTLDRSTDITSARKIREAAEAELQIARAQYYPVISGYLRGGYERNNSQGSTSRLDGDPYSSVGVQSDVVLWTFGAREARTQSARSKIASARAAIRAQLSETSYAVIEAYCLTILERERLKIAEQREQDHLAFRKQVEKSTAAGIAKKSLLSISETRISQKEFDRLDRDARKRKIENTLMAFLGMTPPDLLVEPDPARPTMDSLRSLIDGAIASSPKREQAIQTARALKQEAEAAEAEKLPLVNLHTEGGVDRTFNARETTASGQIMLMVTVPIWNMGAEARVGLARINAGKAQTEVIAQERQIETKVRDALDTIEIAGKQMESAKREQSAAEETLKSYAGERQLGLRELAENLDAIEGVANAKDRVMTTRIAYKLAIYMLLHQEDRLVETLDIGPETDAVIGTTSQTGPLRALWMRVTGP